MESSSEGLTGEEQQVPPREGYRNWPGERVHEFVAILLDQRGLSCSQFCMNTMPWSVEQDSKNLARCVLTTVPLSMGGYAWRCRVGQPSEDQLRCGRRTAYRKRYIRFPSDHIHQVAVFGWHETAG